MGDVIAGVPSVAGEFAGLEVGDARIRARVLAVVDRLSATPDLGFPRALKTERETEGFYRLLANSRLGYRALVEAHARETAARMTAGSTVRVIHDTTEFTFTGEYAREGLGRTRTTNSTQGFYAHVALAVSGDLIARPLGVVGARCWARTAPSRGNRKLSGGQLSKIAEKESSRWGEVVTEVEELVEGSSSLLHLMDREGDSYALFAKMVAEGARFVVRMARDRLVLSTEEDAVDGEVLRLSDALSALPVVVTREVPLGRRAPKSAPRSEKTHPQRVGRMARLALSSGRVALKRPRYLGDEVPDCLELNVVYVQERDAPEGTDPVAWVLVTTEPASSAEQAEAIVDHYRARWMIEEFFKALKTGCAFEERQLESFTTLTNALALFFPIAWQMLLLRTISRADPAAPAEQVLTPTQIKVLQHYQPQKMPKQGATARDALYAVAGLGGHLKNNGPPGWRTLTYGMQDLLKLADAWDAGAQSGSNSR